MWGRKDRKLEPGQSMNAALSSDYFSQHAGLIIDSVFSQPGLQASLADLRSETNRD